jgi:hypothetical protein
MGMSVSQQNGQLCIELDAGGIFSEYSDYIKEFNQTYIDRLNLKNDLAKVLHSEDSLGSTNGQFNSFAKGDGILVRVNGQTQNFPLPRANVDG